MANQIPKWQKEIESFKGIKSLFIIEGNIYDEYPYYDERRGRYLFYDFNEIMNKIFNTGNTANSYDFMFYDPTFGFSSPIGDDAGMAAKIKRKRNKLENIKRDILALNDRSDDNSDLLVRDSEILRTAISEKAESSNGDDTLHSVAVVINFASRFLSSPDNLVPNEISFFLNLQYASSKAKEVCAGCKNTIILAVDKFGDIPSWFYKDNPNIRQISIPNPDRETRKIAIDSCYTCFDEKFSGEKEKYIDLTDGMKIVEIKELQKLLERESENISEISELVSIYKYGFKENKWLQIRNKLRQTDIKAEIHNRVKGQENAIDKAVQIIKRSVVGLSGLQHSSSTKPKGIMFLVGPTGTGKTELVKTITKLLFGDERALIRFDMSEYSEENSDQKLFGAPPGYVGYAQGGQLTNAVRRNPFSVLLFDEIEKAHPTIMDKFLQILEDGRMTDGQGNTVYFSETLIFFTSNKGISEEVIDSATGKIIGRESIIKLGESYEKIHNKVFEAIKRYFKPEVVGRIGESNIVVFDFISEQVANQITESVISNINKNLEKEQKIFVFLTEEAEKWFLKSCMQEKFLESGGRGIGNAVEELYLNPLSDFIFDNDCRENSTIKVDVSNENIVFAVEN